MLTFTKKGDNSITWKVPSKITLLLWNGWSNTNNKVNDF